MLFLFTTFALESECKSTKNISYGKKNIPTCLGKGVSLQRLWDRRCEDETIHIYSIRPGGRGAWGAGSGGAGLADDAVPAAGVVAVLPLVAAAAAVAAGVVAGQVYTWLPAAWRHDGHAEGRRRRRDDGHGTALHLRLHSRGFGGTNHSARGRCRRSPDGYLLCSKREERRLILSYQLYKLLFRGLREQLPQVT